MASLFNNVHFSMSDKIEQQHTQLKIDQDLLVNGNISGNTISCGKIGTGSSSIAPNYDLHVGVLNATDPTIAIS